MAELIRQYYALLSSPANLLTLPLGDLADSINIPLISVLLFGLIGAVAPCQLSTNVAALAFLSRRAADSRKMWAQTLAFVLGKATVYLLIGGVIVLLGWQIDQVSRTAIPVIIFTRRAMGPLLIIVGLLMLGVLQSRLAIGDRLSGWLEEKARRQNGIVPSYLLGAAFAFAFCPTLFWLFFGLTIPLAITSTGGIIFPSIFAIGTALPVLGLAWLMTSGAVNMSQFIARFKAADVWIQRVAGIIFLLVGLNEIILYWIL